MTFKVFEALVKIKTQDSQSKLPPKFADWVIVINEGIKRINDEIKITINSEKIEIKTNDLFETDAGNIPVIEDLTMALVYYVSQMYVSDVTLKQKYLLDYSDELGLFVWNKFKEMELSK